jgi:hypothetical protein
MSAPKDDKAAIRQIIRAVRKAGWDLEYVDDREEETLVTTEDAALDAITAVDEAFLVLKRLDPVPGTLTKLQTRAHIFFVLGNDPEEVACDYTTNLEPAIGPLVESWF